MKFYYAPGTICVATGVLLEEAGLDYDPIRVDFASAEQTGAAYRAINPKGRVPALVTDRGALSETGAISGYIATLAPDRQLIPDDPWDAAQMRAICDYLGATLHVSHAHGPRASRWADKESSWQDMRTRVPGNMADGCDFLEKTCAFGPFVMGARLTVADPWLFAVCNWLKGDGVEIADYPRLATHFAMMNARPSAQRMRAIGLLR